MTDMTGKKAGELLGCWYPDVPASTRIRAREEIKRRLEAYDKAMEEDRVERVKQFAGSAGYVLCALWRIFGNATLSENQAVEMSKTLFDLFCNKLPGVPAVDPLPVPPTAAELLSYFESYDVYRPKQDGPNDFEEQFKGRMLGIFAEEVYPGGLPRAIFQNEEDVKKWYKDNRLFSGGHHRVDLYGTAWLSLDDDPKKDDFQDFVPKLTDLP